MQVRDSFEQGLKSVLPPESCLPCGKCDHLIPFNPRKVSRSMEALQYVMYRVRSS